MRKEYITVKLAGGLGNQLFIWATAIAISQKRNLKLRFDASECTQYGCELELFGIELNAKPTTPPSGTLRSQFPESSNFIIDFLRTARARARFFRVGEDFWERPGGFDRTVFNIKEGKNLRGYFQSYKYFESLREDIRDILGTLKIESKEFLSLSKSFSSSPWVAIHVRRQDYEIMQNTFGLLGESYYKDAIKEIELVLPNVKKYVFSDDIVQAKLLIPGCTGYIGKDELNSASETLILMSQADAIIGSNSSFSWWAAFLMKAEGHLKLFPEPWFVDKKLNSKDLVPPSWNRIPISEE